MATSLQLSPELTCSVCLELFDNPVVLPCMHSFCQQCLIEILTSRKADLTDGKGDDVCQLGATSLETTFPDESQTLPCPDCRQMVDLGTEGVAGLPSNFTLSNIVSKYKDRIGKNENKANVLCSLCEASPKHAIKTCLDCSGVSYCEECLNLYHPLRGPLKKHRLTEPVLEGEQKKKEHQEGVNDDVFRPLLPEKWKTMFCLTCLECFITTSQSSKGHADHDVKGLSDAFLDRKKLLLLENMKLLDETKIVHMQKLQNLQVRREQVEVESSNTAVELNGAFIEMKRILEAKELDVQTSLKEFSDDKLTSLKRTRDMISARVAEICGLMTEFKELDRDFSWEDKVSFIEDSQTHISACQRLLEMDEINQHEEKSSSPITYYLDDLRKMIEMTHRYISALKNTKDTRGLVPVVENVQCTEIKGNTANALVKWKACDGAETYSLRLANGGRTEELILRNLKGEESSGYTVTGLRPDSTYQVSVAAMYNGIEGPYSEAVSLKTVCMQALTPDITLVRRTQGSRHTANVK